MEDWQQRVVDEEIELAERFMKLTKFTGSPFWRQLPPDEKDRLERQQTYMALYRRVLRERIAAWGNGSLA